MSSMYIFTITSSSASCLYLLSHISPVNRDMKHGWWRPLHNFNNSCDGFC